MTLFVLHLKCNHVILGLVGHHILQTGHTFIYGHRKKSIGDMSGLLAAQSWPPRHTQNTLPVLASTPHTEHFAAHGILFQQQQPSRQAAEIILKIGSKIRMKIFVFKSEKNIKLYTVIHI